MSGGGGRTYGIHERKRIHSMYEAGASLWETAEALKRTPWGVANCAYRHYGIRTWINLMERETYKPRPPSYTLKPMYVFGVKKRRLTPPEDKKFANWRVTARYTKGGSEIVERIFCGGKVEAEKTAAEMPQTLMGGVLQGVSLDRRSTSFPVKWAPEPVAVAA